MKAFSTVITSILLLSFPHTLLSDPLDSVELTGGTAVPRPTIQSNAADVPPTELPPGETLQVIVPGGAPERAGLELWTQELSGDLSLAFKAGPSRSKIAPTGGKWYRIARTNPSADRATASATFNVTVTGYRRSETLRFTTSIAVNYALRSSLVVHGRSYSSSTPFLQKLRIAYPPGPNDRNHPCYLEVYIANHGTIESANYGMYGNTLTLSDGSDGWWAEDWVESPNQVITPETTESGVGYASYEYSVGKVLFAAGDQGDVFTVWNTESGGGAEIIGDFTASGVLNTATSVNVGGVEVISSTGGTTIINATQINADGKSVVTQATDGHVSLQSLEVNSNNVVTIDAEGNLVSGGTTLPIKIVDNEVTSLTIAPQGDIKSFDEE